MKTGTLMASVVATIFSTNAAALTVSFADSTWNGSEIPAGQQCQKFGGDNPSTPRIRISDIPSDASAIVLEYSDRDFEKMNNGGHGKMSYTLSSPTTEIDIPSVPGHTFDIPDGITMIEAHRSPGWDKAGAYMPPCSGGKGHAYYVTVKVVEGEKVVAETVLEMGQY